MSTTCGRPQGGRRGGPAHVDACGQRRGGSKTWFFVDVINGWPLTTGEPAGLLSADSAKKYHSTWYCWYFFGLYYCSEYHDRFNFWYCLCITDTFLWHSVILNTNTFFHSNLYSFLSAWSNSDHEIVKSNLLCFEKCLFLPLMIFGVNERNL